MSPLADGFAEREGLRGLRGLAVSGSPLVPLPRHERRRKLDAYLAFLRRRDGTPDPGERRLSAREGFFREIEREAVLWHADLDRAAFERYLRTPAPADLDPRLLWVLAAAKANRAERWAIERELARVEGRRFARDEWMLYIALEEVYHTRILSDACRTVGFDPPMLQPPGLQRVFIRALLPLPRAMRLPLTLAGEIVGCVLFDLLQERVDLFAERPAVEARLRRLVREILTDEVGHVLYCRSMLGALGLGATRLLLPVVARLLLRDLPEFGALAGGSERLLRRIERFDLARID